jgi:hypothetical protein
MKTARGLVSVGKAVKLGIKLRCERRITSAYWPTAATRSCGCKSTISLIESSHQ